MRILMASLLGLMFASTLVGQDQQKKDINALQGSWQVTSGEGSKTKLTPMEAKAIQLVFNEDSLTIKEGQGNINQKIRLDPNKTPKRIDLVSTDSKTKDRVYQGIYEINGEFAKICFSEYGEQRPDEFAAEGKPGIRTFLSLKRAK
jgi:uncharacterized protein (TIGR03067 family)